jgi:hypothetical protein
MPIRIEKTHRQAITTHRQKVEQLKQALSEEDMAFKVLFEEKERRYETIKVCHKRNTQTR